SRPVEYAVDRWVLPRPDYRAALRELCQELNTLDAEPDIFATAEGRIQFLLDLRLAQVVPPKTLPGSALNNCDCDIDVPVRVHGEHAYTLTVAQERCSRA